MNNLMIYALEADSLSLLFTKCHDNFTNKHLEEAKHDM